MIIRDGILAKRAKIHQRGITLWRAENPARKACRSGEPEQKQRDSPDRMRASAATANREECREIEETGKPWRMVGGWLERRERISGALREVILERS